MKLRGLLEQCSLAELHRIAERHGRDGLAAPSRGELIQQLADQLTGAGYLEGWLARLDPPARVMLQGIAVEGGQTRGFVLERRFRHALGDETSERTVRAEIERLLSTGLLYRVFHAAGPDRGETFVMPEELRPLLPTEPGHSGPVPRPLPAPERVLACRPVFALFALASFVRRWRQREVRQASSAGQLAALDEETSELVVEPPGRTSRERWTLLGHLAIQAGLFTREEAGLEYTEELPDWLARGHDGERGLWRAYLGAAHWDDLERAGSGRERFAGRRADPPAARAQVLDVVRRLPSLTWLQPEAVVHAVREEAPDFLREGYDASSSRLLDLQTGDVLAGPGSWDQVEGSMVRYMLSGPLYWLGGVEWGVSDAEADRLRIGERGAALLRGEEAALASPARPLELLDDRRVVAEADADLGLLWQLEPYLLLEQRGPPSVYRLARLSFARGLEAGGSLDDLRRLLERGSGQPLPEAFAAALDRWAPRLGRIHIRPQVVLLTQTAEELDAILERAEVRAAIRERLGPRAASVPAARSQELADLLERQGHLPELDASLRLMAGRRAYAALVDQRVVETLLFSLRALRALDPRLLEGLAEVDVLIRRLETALGPIAGPLLRKRALAAARRTRRELTKRAGRQAGRPD